MRRKPQSRPPDALIAAIAARQHGVIAHRQLADLGLSREGIQRRVRAGRLHPMHRGVYAVGHKRVTQRGRFMAAVLAGGEGAVLSHRSAAALWGILQQRGDIHVTTPRGRRNRDGIEFHSQSLQLDEVTERDGIPVTTVARTLIDIAATEPAQFGRAYNEAEFRRLYDQTGVLAILRRNPSRRGATVIRSALPRGTTRSELERGFLALVDEGGLPRPELNGDLDARLVVELDGAAAHATSSRFDSDRERDRLLVLAGWTVIRLTWKHVTSDADRVAADLRALIA